MKLNGKTVGVDGSPDVITSKSRGAIPVAPVVRRAYAPEIVGGFNGDVDRIAGESRKSLWPILTVVLLAAAGVTVAISDKDGKPSVSPEPVRGLEYDDETLNDEINCLRTWFAAQCSRFTDAGEAFLEQDCNQGVLDELGTNPEVIVVARDGILESAGIYYSSEEWERVDGNLGNLKVETWAESGNKVRVPKKGYPYTKRVFSK